MINENNRHQETSRIDWLQIDIKLQTRARWEKRSRGLQACDLEDSTQEAYLRFIEKGMAERVDPSRGNIFLLLSGVRRFVIMESNRKRAQTETEELPAEITAIEPQTTLERERMEVIGRWFRDEGVLTQRERVALVRWAGGSLFGCTSAGAFTDNDATAACRARQKLGRLAGLTGLHD